jgi:hypothetical protein
MITNFFISLWGTVSTWFLGLLPQTDPVGNFIVTAQSWLSSLLEGASKIGVWLPWDYLSIALPITLAFYFTLLLVKAAKNLWSYVPFFGGSG